METLESLGQQNLLFFKENEKKEIKTEFDVVIQAYKEQTKQAPEQKN